METSIDLTDGTAESSMTIAALSPVTHSRRRVNSLIQSVELSAAERQTATISLPLPQELVWATELDWSPEDRNQAQNFLSNFGEVKEQFQAAPKEFIGNLSKRFSGVAFDAFGSRTRLGRNGEAVNPLKEIFFNGVSNRTFNFSWRLFPKNAAQATQYRDVIRALNVAAHPDIADNSGGGLFEIPNHFTVSFSGVILPTIKNCVCTSIIDNFTANGVPRFQKDGNPSFVEFSMTLTELEIPLKQDWEG